MPDLPSPAEVGFAKAGGFRLLASPHPASLDRLEVIAPAGASIARVLYGLAEHTGIPPAVLLGSREVQVLIADGQMTRPPVPIRREAWLTVKPKPGTTLIVNVVPGKGGGGGGGGKSPLRIVLTIAVIAAAFYLGPAIAGGFGLVPNTLAFQVVSGIAGAVVTTVGNLLIDAIIPPPQPQRLTQLGSTGPRERTSPQFAITGARNRIVPGGVVPRVFGRVLIFPPQAAPPYPEVVGDDVYWNMLLDLGPGPVRVSDLRIGETPIQNFQDIEVEIREGWADDAPLTLFRNQVFTDSMSILVSKDGGAITVETRGAADEVLVNLLFNGLVRFDNSGNQQERSVDLKIDYRRAGSQDEWQSGFSPDGPKTTTSFITEIHVEERWAAYRTDVPVAGPVTVEIGALEGSIQGSNVTTSTRFRVLARTFDPARGPIADEDMPISPNNNVLPPTSFTLQHDFNLNAGATKAVEVQGTAGQQLEVVILLWGIWVQSSPSPIVWVPENDTTGGAYRMWATPVWSYPTTADTVHQVTFTATARTADAVRRAVRLVLPETGRYELRVRRLTDDTSDAQIRDEAFLAGVQTVRFESPVKVTGHCQIALRARATDQLNGILDRVNCVAQAVYWSYDGSTWAWRESRLAADAFIEVLTGPGNRKPVDAAARLKLDRLMTWRARCAAAAPQSALFPPEASAQEDDPSWAFDAVVDFETTVKALLDDICAAGRARRTMIDGKHAVALDELQAAPVQHFTPLNMRDFEGERVFLDLPHALRVRFRNEERRWEPDEILVYADDFDATNATEIDEMEVFGATQVLQNWRIGRYHMAVARLRPVKYKGWTDIEGLPVREGDLVRASHDLVRWGEGWARVRSVTVDGGGDATAVELDQAMAMEAGKSYQLRLRLADGRSVMEAVDTVPGEATTLTFTTPIPAAYVIATGDMAMFGTVTGQETRRLVVGRIVDYDEDLNVQLEFVDEAPGVYTAEEAELPETTTAPATDPTKAAPAAVTDLAAVERVTQIGDGVVVDLLVSWLLPAGSWAAAFEVYDAVDGATAKLIDVVETRDAVIPRVAAGLAHKITVLAVGAAGAKRALAEAASTVIVPTGELPAPAAPTGFTLTFAQGQAMLAWAAQADADHWDLEITQPVSAGATLGGELAATQSVEVFNTAKTVPVPLAGDYVFELFAVNIQGARSAAPVKRTLTQNRAWAENAVASQAVATTGGAFTGAMCRTGSDQIRRSSLAGTPWFVPTDPRDCSALVGPWELQDVPPADLAALDPAWLIGPQFDLVSTWESGIVDFGAAIDGIWYVDFKAEVLDKSSPAGLKSLPPAVIAEQPPSVLVADNATVEVAMVLGLQSDLSDGGNAQVFAGSARYAKVIVTTRTESWAVETLVEGITVKVDAPDIIEGGTKTLSATPETFSFAKTYRQTPAVVIAQLGGGAAALDSATPTGFTVSGAISDQFSYHVQGV